MESQFNTIKYINGLDISSLDKRSLEIYICGDQFQKDLDSVTGDIKTKCIEAITKELNNIQD